MQKLGHFGNSLKKSSDWRRTHSKPQVLLANPHKGMAPQGPVSQPNLFLGIFNIAAPAVVACIKFNWLTLIQMT